MTGIKTKYTAEFKKNVLARVELGIESQAQIARDLGINENTLSGWVKKARLKPEDPFPGSGNVSSDDERMRRLEKELRDLREENEILKKAAAYFAKNQR